MPSLPKTLVHHLLAPALDLDATSLLVQQDTAAGLLDSLVAGRLHAVLLNDVPTPPAGARVHSHLLGETDILLYARARLAQTARRDFPMHLPEVPFILPPEGAPLRRRLDAWFVEHDLRILVKAEVDDAGLLRALGAAGRGVFPVRATLKSEVEDVRDIHLVGKCEGLRERYYIATTERRVRQQALAALIDGARTRLNAARGLSQGR